MKGEHDEHLSSQQPMPGSPHHRQVTFPCTLPLACLSHTITCCVLTDTRTTRCGGCASDVVSGGNVIKQQLAAAAAAAASSAAVGMKGAGVGFATPLPIDLVGLSPAVGAAAGAAPAAVGSGGEEERVAPAGGGFAAPLPTILTASSPAAGAAGAAAAAGASLAALMVLSWRRRLIGGASRTGMAAAAVAGSGCTSGWASAAGTSAGAGLVVLALALKAPAGSATPRLTWQLLQASSSQEKQQ
jgi:hypothetical protein